MICLIISTASGVPVHQSEHCSTVKKPQPTCLCVNCDNYLSCFDECTKTLSEEPKVIKFHNSKFDRIMQNDDNKNSTENLVISSSGTFKVDRDFASSYPNLTKITMIFNKLANDNQPLRMNLTENKKISTIELRINHLSQFPEIESDSVELLDVSQNNIRSININVSAKFPNLKYLYLERNRLTTLDLNLTPSSMVEIHMHVNNLPCGCTTYSNFKKMEGIIFKKKGLYCNNDNVPVLYADESGLLPEFDTCGNNVPKEGNIMNNNTGVGLRPQLSEYDIQESNKIDKRNIGIFTEMSVIKNVDPEKNENWDNSDSTPKSCAIKNTTSNNNCVVIVLCLYCTINIIL